MPQYHLESKLLLLNLFIKRQARGEGLGCEGRESKVAFFASVVCRRNHRSKKLRVPPSDPFLSRPFRPLRSSPVVERERFLIGCAEKKHYGRTRRSLLAPKTVALLVWSQPRFRNLARARSTLSIFSTFSLQTQKQMADEDTFLFTSESVNEGHPDKLADQVRRRRGWKRSRERVGAKVEKKDSNGNIGSVDRSPVALSPQSRRSSVFSSILLLLLSLSRSTTGLRRHSRCLP